MRFETFEPFIFFYFFLFGGGVLGGHGKPLITDTADTESADMGVRLYL